MFAVACNHLYEELKGFQDRLALFLLLEKVAEKEKEFLRERKIQRDRAELKEDAYSQYYAKKRISVRRVVYL